MALGGGPIHAMPASTTSWAKSAFSARNPKPGWMASAPAERAASTTALRSRRSSASFPVVSGTTARMPRRSHVRVIRSRDLAAVRDEDGGDGARRGPQMRPPERQTRQTRHAIDHQRVEQGAYRWRSSAGRSESTFRAASRPRSGSALRPFRRECRIRNGQRLALSPRSRPTRTAGASRRTPRSLRGPRR